MSRKANIRISVALAVLVVGWLLLGSSYRFYWQTYCVHNPDGQYMGVVTKNGLLEGGVAFVSDGVIYTSSPFHIPYTTDYLQVERVIYDWSWLKYRLLSVEHMNLDGELVRQEIGRIDQSCWDLLKKHLAKHHEAAHIDLLDKSEPNVSGGAKF